MRALDERLGCRGGIYSRHGRIHRECGREQCEGCEALAEANCATCHAVSEEGESPLAKAPPFRDLHKRYPVESLAEALAEGITTGHSTMPEFEFEPKQVDEIIDYLKTLEP